MLGMEQVLKKMLGMEQVLKKYAEKNFYILK